MYFQWKLLFSHRNDKDNWIHIQIGAESWVIKKKPKTKTKPKNKKQTNKQKKNPSPSYKHAKYYSNNA